MLVLAIFKEEKRRLLVVWVNKYKYIQSQNNWQKTKKSP